MDSVLGVLMSPTDGTQRRRFPILYNIPRCQIPRGTMANLTNALQQLRAERREAQLHVEKLGKAISMIESLNGSGTSRSTNQPKRIISAASRRKMAQAQRARWARAGKGARPAARAGSAHKKGHTMSASARRKIAAAQRARWAKVRAQQK